MTPSEVAAILRQFNVWRRGADVPQPKPREIGEAIDAAVDMIERLEAAESDALEQARMNGMGASREAALMAKLEAAEKEREELHILIAAIKKQARSEYVLRVKKEEECAQFRARIEEMEKQEPAGYVESLFDEYVILVNNFDRAAPVYLSPGAQPAPIEQDTSVRKAWARFSNELHRSPDAPYPGMSESFEQHFSQSFTDREWRAESATWAAAWKAAKRHEVQAQPAPSIPEGWKLIPEKHPTFDLVDLRLADGSVLCGCVPQSDGDYWWEGPSGEVFIDPKYAPVTQWRLAAEPEAKP